MKHEDMLLTRPCGKTRKCIPPESDAIHERKRHGSAFISKPTMVHLDLIQIFRQHVLVCFLQCGVIAAKKNMSDIFQAVSNFGAGAGESTALKRHFPRVNF